MGIERNGKSHRLTRSEDRVLAGVCGGIAKFLGWQPRAARAMWCLVTLLTGFVPGALAYMLLGFAMPPPDQKRFNLDDFRVR